MQNCCVLICCILAGTIQCVLKVGVPEFLSIEYPDFVEFTPDGKCGESFECEILNAICTELGQECELDTQLKTFDDRISFVEEGKSNISISVISVTPERAERVYLVRPYYYYSGAVIFQPEDTPLEEQLGWEDIRDLDICASEGYFAAPAIAEEFGPNFVFGGRNDASAIESGICDAVISDNTAVVVGLKPNSKTEPLFGAPYAIAVSKEDRETLGAQISEILVNLMTDGPNSLILQFEDEHVVKGGGQQPSQRLANLVEAMTQAGGILPTEKEDEIWG